MSEFESRYAQINADAIDDPELTLTDLRVLGVIGYHSGRKKPAWPKQATIAARLKVARESVNRSIRRLHRKGYIDIAHQFRDDGGQRESYYFPRLDPDPAILPVEVVVNGKPLKLVPRVTGKSQGESDGAVTPPVTQLDHTPCDLAKSHLEEHPIGTPHKNKHTSAKADTDVTAQKSTKPPVSAQVRSEFDGLWNLWGDAGRKRSKARDLCLDAFARACRDHAPPHVVEAAAAFVAKQKPEFVPGLHRWLSDRRYEHFLPRAAQLPLEAAGTTSAAETTDANPVDRNGQAVDWDAAVAKYVRSGIWPNRLGGRPDEHDYRGTIEPLEAIMANGRFRDLNVVTIRNNISRLRAARAA